jgi:hypothetical protein
MLCDALPSLKDTKDRLGVMVVEVECGSINPSASNLSILNKLTIHRCISSIQGVLWDFWCCGPETCHMVGVGAQRGVGALVSAAGPSHGQLQPAMVRPSLARCSRTWPGAAVPC